MNSLRKALFFLFLLSPGAYAQDSTVRKPVLAMVGIDTHRIGGIDSAQMASMLLIELETINRFEVMDHYEQDYILRKSEFKEARCFSKTCLLDAGRLLGADKMFLATIESFPEQILMTFKILDVKSASIEQTRVFRYLFIPKEIPLMIQVSVSQMFGLYVDPDVLTKLTKKNDFDNAVNNPYQLRLRADGPRMGMTMFTGKTARILESNPSQGGYHASRFMYQFGYQFEKQYLNEGNFQALFEFVPMVTGLDQGLFIPSLAVLNGLRDNKYGWEIAFGPTISLVTKSKGYYDEAGQWKLESDTTGTGIKVDMEHRLDSRGDIMLNPGFVLAVGRTFKSGRLNIPVNLYVVPGREGVRYGFSLGFNAKDRYHYSANN